MKSVCFAVFLLFAVVQGGKVCTDISQCQAGECCQIMSEFMVVSKRDLVLATKLPEILKPVRAGTCEPYRLEGSHCGSFEKMNGYCGCEPGTHCKTEEVAIATMTPLPTLPPLKTLSPVPISVSKRSMIPPRPGYQWISTCKKI